ncbi:MAG TPA: MFS transporter [Usitatibacteraceae bacterium]
MKLPDALRSLRSPNFRAYYIGQAVSQLGSWMQSVAITWLAYRLSGSTATTGMIGFLAMAPYIFVTPIAGALSDRVSRRKVLIVVQCSLLVLAVALASVTATGHITIPLLGTLAFTQGVLNGVEVPTRHAFFVQLIEDRQDLPNAIALNSININSTRLIGPAIGGLLIAGVGEAACFGINAITYLAVLVQLLRIRVHEPKKNPGGQSLLKDLVEGWRFGFSQPVVRILVIMVGAVSFAVSPYTILMPAISIGTFNRGAELNGLFISCVGIGALTGAIILARRPNVRGLTRWVAYTASIAALGIIGFSFSRNIWLSFLFMAMTGMGLMGTSVCVNTIIQTIVDEDKRGRVVSIYSTFFIGSAPLGHLAAGWLAEHIGAPRTFLACGLFCALATIVYVFKLPTLRLHIRPLYAARGIIPAPDTEIQK